MGVSKPDSDDQIRSGLNLRLEEFFNGECQAWGMFESRTGTIKNYFTVLTSGTWDGERLCLKEKVSYPDRSVDKRDWTIFKTGPNTYQGYTEGLKGEAKGTVNGPHFHWRYRLCWKYKKHKWTTDFDDQMWLHNNSTLINRATIRKYGVRIGQAWLFFSRTPPSHQFN